MFNVRYQWKTGSWGECEVQVEPGAGSNQCGGGLMYRNITCMDTEKGRPTLPHHCLGARGGGIRHQLVQK